MTPIQFETLVKLIRSRGPGCAGARLVLVDGWSNAEAARAVPCAPQAVANTVSRLRAADASIRAAYPVKRGG